MKKILLFAVFALSGFMLFGCGLNGKTVGKNVKIGDVTEFYYTYSNINYNPVYQRYHFYAEDGKYFFLHDHREKKDDYGPLSEEDRTQYGTVELTEDEWQEFFGYLDGGSVKNREDDATSGDSGPWYYLYWKGDRGKCQEFSFESMEKADGFVDFCVKLSER